MLPFVAFLTSIAITPGLSFESQVLPKFTVFTVSTIACFAVFFATAFERLAGSLKLICSLALSTVPILLLINPSNLSEQIFGVFARNNGALLFVCCILFFILGASCDSETLNRNVLSLFQVSNVFVVMYFVLQKLGLDPVEWQNTYSTPTSTLGNPNFLSAFLAISIFSHLEKLKKSSSMIMKLAVSVILIINVYTIFLCKSLQGFLLVSLGLAIWGVLHFGLFRRQVLKKSITVLTIATFFVFAVSVAGFGPFDSIVRNALGTRVEYWLAGIKIFAGSPFFGKGFDSYLYYFDSVKSQDFIEGYGDTLTSSSSHNYVIDLLVSGGLLIFIPITLLFITVLNSIRKIVKKQKFLVRNNQSILITTWILLQLQALISVPHVSSLAWCALISGALVGSSAEGSNRLLATHRQRSRRSTSKSIVVVLIGLSTAIASSLPLVQDIRFATALKKLDGNGLISVSETFPYDTFRANYISETMLSAKYLHWSKIVTLNSVDKNPRNLTGWRMLQRNPVVDKRTKNRATLKVTELTGKAVPKND